MAASVKIRTSLPRLRWAVDPDLVDNRLNYIAARAAGTHAYVDPTLHALSGVADLAGGATQAQANTRANLLKTAMLEHMASVGTPAVAGAHKAEDVTYAATLSAIAAASDLATSITLVNGLLAAVKDHGDAVGVHFHNDAVAVAEAITTDPPVTLANVITDLNDLLDAYRDHFAMDEDTVNS